MPDFAKDVIDVPEKCMGSMGRFHWLVVFSIFCLKIPVAWHLTINSITHKDIPFTCKNESMDKCDKDCPEHIFDRSIFDYSPRMQFDLVCDRTWLSDLTTTFVYAGIFIGNFLFGFLSDRFGRKRPLVLATAGIFFIGCAVSFMPYLWAYMLSKFVLNLFVGGTMITSFVLLMELIGIGYRTLIGIAFQLPFNLGLVLMPGIAYFIRDWQHLQLACSLPAVFMLSYWFFIPESPRWLLTIGRVDDAVICLESIAKKNKLPTENIRIDIENFTRTRRASRRGTLGDLVSNKPMTLRFSFICYIWLVTGMCFYGGFTFMGLISHNVYLNVFLGAILQIPSTLLMFIILDWWGRRWSTIAGNVLGGISFLVIASLRGEHLLLNTIMGSIAMAGFNMLWSAIYVYTTELFPTTIRNIGVGSSSMAARIGAMASPLVVGLKEVYGIQFVAWIFTIFPAVAVVLCFLLPETRGRQLPDTLEDAMTFSKSEAKSEVKPEVKPDHTST